MPKITFVEPDGTEKTVDAPLGVHLHTVALKNDIDLECACGGSLACATCHLVFPQEIYDNLPPSKDEEEDMLDLAFGLTSTSRLGCQIPVTEEMDGITIHVPKS